MLAILAVQRALVAKRAIDRLAGVLEATAHRIVVGRANPGGARWRWRPPNLVVG